MKEFKPNEVIPYKGKLYKVINRSNSDCTNCAFYKNDTVCEGPMDLLPCLGGVRRDATSVKFISVTKSYNDLSLYENDDNFNHRTIADMTIKVEEGVSCADCAFCNVCHANGAGAKNDFYFNVKDYFGECASDKRKDGKSVIFTIKGKNTLYIPFTGGDAKVNDDSTSNSNEVFTLVHPTSIDGKYNNIQVVVPASQVVDVEHSDIANGIIRFKSKYINYADIVDYLYLSHNVSDVTTMKDNAWHKLQNIADYYNDAWRPNWNNHEQTKYYIAYDYGYNRFIVVDAYNTNPGVPVFAIRENAQLVIDNPNFKNILDTIFGNN